MSAADELNAAYARIPDVQGCDGSCSTACRSVPAGPAEVQALLRANGARLTGPTLGEIGGLPADGQLTSRPGHVCPILDKVTRQCTAYDARPAICRLYGAVDDLPCARGCKPAGGMLRRATARRILRSAMAVPADPTEEP